MDLPPPMGALPPASPPAPPRKVWPWVVGGLAVLLGLVILLGAVGFGAYRYVQTKQREEAAIRKVEQVSRQNVEEQRRSLNEHDEAITGASDRLARAKSALGDAAQQAGGEERKVLEAGQRVISGLQPHLKSYESAFTALRDAGMFLPKTLPSRDSIAARRELLRAFNAANEDLAGSYAGLSSGFKSELRTAGIPAARADVEVRAFEGSAHLPEQLQLRAQDRRMVRDGDELLDLLGREWGQWSAGADGRAIFRNDATLKHFQDIVQRLQATGQEQVELQRRMFDRVSPPAGTPNPPVNR